MSPEISAELAASAQARQISDLRTPVSGNASIAHTGSLTCFVSGPRPAFEAVRPLLASFTWAKTYLGEAEQARYAKLAVNLMIAVIRSPLICNRPPPQGGEEARRVAELSCAK